MAWMCMDTPASLDTQGTASDTLRPICLPYPLVTSTSATAHFGSDPPCPLNSDAGHEVCMDNEVVATKHFDTAKVHLREGLGSQGMASYMSNPQQLLADLEHGMIYCEGYVALALVDPWQLVAHLQTTEVAEEPSDEHILDLIQSQACQRKACGCSETDPVVETGDIETFPVEFALHGGKLGVTIDPVTMDIIDIREGSLLEYNRRRSNRSVHLGDRFLEVNGIKIENTEHVKVAIQAAVTVRATVYRPKSNFFSQKACSFAGDASLITNSRFGFCCSKGMKRCPNQDSWCAIELEGAFSIYGVFDGHGPDGHHVSQFVKDRLPRAILQHPQFLSSDMTEMLKDSFLDVQSQLIDENMRGKVKARESGTTATVVIHDLVNSRLVVAHVGDSTAAIARKSRRLGFQFFGSWVVSSLTEDHRPQLSQERARIEKAGGRVEFNGRNHRVYASPSLANGGLGPGLTLSRSFGDLDGKDAGVISAVPDVSQHSLSGEDDALLLLGSDGVWEQLPPKECGVGLQGSSAEALAESLHKTARERWGQDLRAAGYIDDITALVACLNPLD